MNKFIVRTCTSEVEVVEAAQLTYDERRVVLKDDRGELVAFFSDPISVIRHPGDAVKGA